LHAQCADGQPAGADSAAEGVRAIVTDGILLEMDEGLSKRSSERSMSSASPKNSWHISSIERTCVEARGAVVSTRMQGSWRISSNQERTS
jgi:hypothetical protein